MPQVIEKRRAWNAGLRWFHWINATCIFALMGTGAIMLRAGDFGLDADGRYFVEAVHVHIAYVFVLNLAWRVYLGFFGPRHARWSSLIPRGPRYFARLSAYVRGWLSGHPPVYLGHNPLVRLIGTLTLLALLTQAGIGLALARGDLYLPPYQGYAAARVAQGHAAPTPRESRPYPPALVQAHIIVFFIIAAFTVLHIAGVILMDIAEGSGMISATFTGDKYLRGPPAEELPPEAGSGRD